jgi:hypothetical protein
MIELASVSDRVNDLKIIGVQTNGLYLFAMLCKISIIIFVPQILGILYYDSREENRRKEKEV